MKPKLISKNSETKQLMLNAVDWVNNWYSLRKATGKFDDLLGLPWQDRTTIIRERDLGGDVAGMIATNPNLSVISVNPYAKPVYGKDLESTTVHELGHSYSLENAAGGMPMNLVKGSPMIDKASEILGTKNLKDSQESIAQLMQMRHAMKADPNKIYKEKELNSWLKRFGLPTGDKGVRLMNEIALIRPQGIHKMIGLNV